MSPACGSSLSPRGGGEGSRERRGAGEGKPEPSRLRSTIFVSSVQFLVLSPSPFLLPSPLGPWRWVPVEDLQVALRRDVEQLRSRGADRGSFGPAMGSWRPFSLPVPLSPGGSGPWQRRGAAAAAAAGVCSASWRWGHSGKVDAWGGDDGHSGKAWERWPDSPGGVGSLLPCTWRGVDEHLAAIMLRVSEQDVKRWMAANSCPGLMAQEDGWSWDTRWCCPLGWSGSRNSRGWWAAQPRSLRGATWHRWKWVWSHLSAAWSGLWLW